MEIKQFRVRSTHARPPALPRGFLCQPCPGLGSWAQGDSAHLWGPLRSQDGGRVEQIPGTQSKVLSIVTVVI